MVFVFLGFFAGLVPGLVPRLFIGLIPGFFIGFVPRFFIFSRRIDFVWTFGLRLISRWSLRAL